MPTSPASSPSADPRTTSSRGRCPIRGARCSAARALLEAGGVYSGGRGAGRGQPGAVRRRILYVGDHIFGDVHVTKSVLRWRTGLVLRELEDGAGAPRWRSGTPSDG